MQSMERVATGIDSMVPFTPGFSIPLGVTPPKGGIGQPGIKTQSLVQESLPNERAAGFMQRARKSIAEIRNWTGDAYDLAETLTEADIPTLREMSQTARSWSQNAMKNKEYQAGLDFATESQYYREAVERFTNTGSGKRPE